MAVSNFDSIWMFSDGCDGFRPVTAGSSWIPTGCGCFRVMADEQNIKKGGEGKQYREEMRE